MKRRRLIFLLGGAAAAWPLTVRSQRKMPLIGFLGGADPVGYALQMEALHLGLRDHGYVAGQTVAIEYRWAEGKYERLPALAAELVRLNVDIIVTHGTPAALAAKQATTTIPIVMAIVGNPVETGIVTSLARPGGNVTGSSFFDAELNAKRLELMKVLIPGLARTGALINPDNPAMASLSRKMEETARAMSVDLHFVKVRHRGELNEALEKAKAQIEALIVIEDGLFLANAKHIAEQAMRHRLPSVGFREYCEAGGLMAYAVNFPRIWRGSMVLVDKILKGAKPADLPIEQATRFEFVINLKTAKALGLTVPQILFARADEVIE
jgi:putative tryptophan/tyrosine transport system substrate-binding protein